MGTLRVRIVDDVVTTDSAGGVVESRPVLPTEERVQNTAGTWVDPIEMEEAEDGVPIRIVDEAVVLDSAGVPVAATPGKGVGVSAFYSTSSRINGLVLDYPDGTPEDADEGFPTARRAELLDAGVTDARLFFDTEALYDAANEAARIVVINGWSDEIAVFVTAGFRVIVCWTPNNADKAAVQASMATYNGYSDEIATILAADFTPAEVAFMPFNEPVTDAAWGPTSAPALVSAIRAVAPLHRIFITPENGHLAGVDAMAVAMFADRNVSLAVHEYRNTSITHPKSLEGVDRLTWPLTDYPGGKAAVLADMGRKLTELGYDIEDAGVGEALYDSNAAELSFVYDFAPGETEMLADWTDLAAWADTNGIPRVNVVVTETGIEGHYILGPALGQDLSMRAAFLTSVKSVIDGLGFGGIIGHKALGDAFSFFNYTTHAGVLTWTNYLTPELATAMGWTSGLSLGAEAIAAPDAHTGWTANAGEVTLSTENRAMKIEGDGAYGYPGVYREIVASGSSGRTFRVGILMQRIQGATKAMNFELRSDNVTKQIIQVQFVGEYFLEATMDAADTEIEMFAQNQADNVYHISQQTCREVDPTP